jgi:hypothetical protein
MKGVGLAGKSLMVTWHREPFALPSADIVSSVFPELSTTSSSS